jgi:hypothetical protein
MEKKPIAEKSVRLAISRTAYEELKSLAGPDISPAAYLERIVGDLAKGQRGKISEPALPEGVFIRNELSIKLDSLAHSLERLTDIVLENQRHASPNRDQPRSTPPAEGNQVPYLYPSSQVGQEERGEMDIEGKIRKYEEENPW